MTLIRNIHLFVELGNRELQEETLGKRAVNLKSIGQVFHFLHSIAKSILSVDNS